MKRHSVHIHHKATDELDRIYRFISEDNRANAKKFVAGLQKTILNLSQFPSRGTPCQIISNDPDSPIRFVVHKGYMIFYQVVKESVQILHISAPGQDWLALFL